MDFTARKQNIFSLVVCKEAEHLNVRHAKMQDEYSGIYDCAGVAPISFDLDMPQEVKIQFFGEHAAIRELVDMNRADGIWADLIYGYLCVLCGCLYMHHSLNNIFIVFPCFIHVCLLLLSSVFIYLFF